MSESVVLCGYSLGRFVPSRNAFVGRRHVARFLSGRSKEASSDPSVFITIISAEDRRVRRQEFASSSEPSTAVGFDALGPGVLTERGDACVAGREIDGPRDVGRAPNGDLVLVEDLGALRPSESHPCESHPCESDPCESDPCESDPCESDSCESGPTDSTLSFRLIDRESRPSRASRFEPAAPAEHVATGWSGTRRELSQRVAFFAGRHGSRVAAFKREWKISRGKKARLLGVFGAVGAVVVVGLLLSLGDGSQEAPADSTSDPTPAVASDRLSVSGAPTEVDPIDYAIVEVTAGRVYLEGMAKNGKLVGDGTVDGRVVSRSGDIVLVEVSLTVAETKTFATLLLQEEEGGWRTRDVF